MPDQFDLRGPADGLHRSAGRAGGTRAQARWCCKLSVTGAADRGRRGYRLCPYQLPCRRYSPCKESTAPDLPRRLAAGDCLMGVQLGVMVIWTGLRDCGCSAGTAGAAAGGCHRAPPMIKRSEAAAAVRPGPAAPFRLTALAVSAVHPPKPVRRACAAASFACELRARPALVVLAWGGDRSPFR